MKKVLLSVCLVIAMTGGTFAQKANVSKAKNKALQETPDFAGAREAIKAALADPTTKDDAQTWYVAGLIGYKENEALYNKMILQQKVDADVKGKAVMESYDYFIKAYALDSLPDAKGKIKPKFQKDIKPKIKEYYSTQQNLFAYGASLFEKKDYEGAIKVFDVYLGIPNLPMFKNEIKPDSSYYMIKYFTGIAAVNAEKHEKAVQVFSSMTNNKYEEMNVHQLLYQEYMAVKDTTNAVATLKAGFEKFPKETWFMQNLINYYIFSNKAKDAIVYLDKAIETEPNLAQYRYVKGSLDETLGNIESARASFEKAVELDPNSSSAYAGLGRLIYNEAVKMLEKANDIKDNRAYNAAKKQADDVFVKSIPYFKKAAELNPKELEYKRTLKNLYYRLKMDKEYEAIDKEMNQ
jgi:tetratricopeptide (TPR) repeat protein